MNTVFLLTANTGEYDSYSETPLCVSAERAIVELFASQHEAEIRGRNAVKQELEQFYKAFSLDKPQLLANELVKVPEWNKRTITVTNEMRNQRQQAMLTNEQLYKQHAQNLTDWHYQVWAPAMLEFLNKRNVIAPNKEQNNSWYIGYFYMEEVPGYGFTEIPNL